MTQYALQEVLGVLIVFGLGFGWWAKVVQIKWREI